jgi:ABC-2 type transport system ATP-binding protein
MREVGALLDAKAVHGGRSAYNHLLCLAQTNNLPRRRVGEVLELVGLTEVARKRSKGFSLGMSQRLGIAATMLGDPEGADVRRAGQRPGPRGHPLDQEPDEGAGAEGRTVFVSSHLMSEMEYTADHLIVIGRGQADRRLLDVGVHRPLLRRVGAGPHADGGRADQGRHRQGRGRRHRR